MVLKSKHRLVEPVSPQPSVDRLSVTFAGDDLKGTPTDTIEKVRFNNDPMQVVGEESHKTMAEEDDEYSASVSAIMTRQGSRGSRKRRGSKRRGSSPFSPDPDSYQNVRRRSSVFTTSSGETAISVEDNTTQEQIFHKMKVHKEVLSQVKHQPWPIRRKVKLVQTAKAYIKRHEGALQERLAHNKSTKDVLAHFNIILINQWHHLKRELANLSNVLIPWESRIKEIESHFGSVVASYFTFLRWLFSVNLVISIVLVTFVCLPEVFMGSKADDGERKNMLPEEEMKAKNLITLWNFEGILKYSPLFYGYYNNRDGNGPGFWYRLPFAYFMTGLAVYIYSFVAILRKMAENSRQSKLSEKDDECTFTWKVFTGWDYMIGNAETAHNRTASIILGFKEALLEEEEKKRDEGRNWKMTSIRIFTHLKVLCLISTSVYVVILVVRRSTEPEAESSWWRQSEVTIVVTLIGFIYPVLFDLIGLLERYHPRKALRMQLARIMVLNLLNLYSFIFATFSKINNMTIQLRSLKPNDTLIFPNATTKTILESNLGLQNDTVPLSTAASTTDNNVFCSRIMIDCPVTSTVKAVTSFLLLNTTFLTYSPTITNFGNNFTNLPENISSYPLDYDYDYNNTDFMSLAHTIALQDQNETSSYYTEYNTTYETVSYWKSDNISDITTTTPILNISRSEQSIDKCYIIKCVTNNNDTTEYNESETFNIQNWTITSIGHPYLTSLGTAEPDAPVVDLSHHTSRLDHETRKRLRTLCWETMFGQELVKLTIMDLVITVTSILMMDFFRAVFVRLMNNCWCWDLEKNFPQYGDFKIAENILHLVNNQGMVWMGMFFSPGLPIINLLKLTIIMYMRSWAVLTCNVPHEVVFKASRSNNFYFALLLTMLFLCVLPVGYAIVWVEPSWHCGPFSNYKRIYHLFTRMLKKVIPKYLHKALDYIASPGIVIPLLMLLILIIYYLISLTNALREANNDLKIQLRRERTEERRKVFQLANKKRKGTDVDTPFNKWRKLLNSVPEGPRNRVDIGDIRSDSQEPTDIDKKEIMNSFLQRAIRKSSNTSDEGIPQIEKDVEDTKRGKMKGIHSVIRSALKMKSIEKKPAEKKSGPKADEDSKKFREREDSTVSGWSADIPEIKIIETDSNENTLEASPDPAKHSMSSSMDTVIAIDLDNNEDKAQRKRVPLSRTKLNQEEDDSQGYGDSYESIAASIKRIHDLTDDHKSNEEATKIKARKAIASALVNEARRRRNNKIEINDTTK